MTLTRRNLLQQASMLALASFVAPASLAATPAPVGLPFSYDWLISEAARMAEAPYQKPTTIKNEWLRGLNYDQYRDIRFKRGQGLWHERGYGFRAEYFHLGALYIEPVELFEVTGRQARRIAYDPTLFNFGKLTPPDELKDAKLAYAGFRLQTRINKPDVFDEFLVFLGASYFRSVGKDEKYGLSARGLAINTATANGEEFPSFRKFWLERPKGNSLTVYALLDSPSITGAYRFVVTPGVATTMDVSCKLFARQDIERLGVAPLTSMYAFGENDDRLNHDFRPEVHDSDSLLMQTGTSEWVLRPLLNPETLGISSFMAENPKGFGLLQRDRDFTSYQDLEALYEDRPSLWVEPKGDWGKGSVQLVEIPTDSEIHDNIVAYWVPEAQVKAGQKLSFDYKLSWGNVPTGRRPLQVMSTHIGRQFDQHKTKFVIDFKPSYQRQQIGNAALQPEAWSGAGQISALTLAPNPHTGGWRMSFDLEPDGNQVHELRCLLRQGGKQVSETWSYQWKN